MARIVIFYDADDPDDEAEAWDLMTSCEHWFGEKATMEVG